MSLRKYLSLLFAFILVFAVACGGGKEVVDEKELGEDDGAEQTQAADNTAGGETAAAPAAAPAAVVADAATLNCPKPDLMRWRCPRMRSIRASPPPRRKCVPVSAWKVPSVFVCVTCALSRDVDIVCPRGTLARRSLGNHPSTGIARYPFGATNHLVSV